MEALTVLFLEFKTFRYCPEYNMYTTCNCRGLKGLIGLRNENERITFPPACYCVVRRNLEM